ncbi:ETS-domain lacking isoform 2-T4 [Cochliomyia hominivorax]
MEVESLYPKYSNRVPPLDLSHVNADSDLHEIWPSKIDFINPSKNNIGSTNMHHSYYNLHHNKFHEKLSSKPNKFLNTSSTTLSNLANYDDLPSDPRDWTRTDVWKWLISMALSEGLDVTPELTQKFLMNGKALCLMSLDMYLSRIPVGGKMLYRDFRVRLAKAISSLY